MATVAVLHCTFLMYLHFGFESMVEGRRAVFSLSPFTEIDEIIGVSHTADGSSLAVSSVGESVAVSSM